MGTKRAEINLADPRVRRTRRLLRETLIALILEKDYRTITIKDITNRAEVAYITFFRHYDSIDDLLLEALEGGLSELQSRIQEAADRPEDGEAEGRLIFEYVQQNATLFHILLQTPGAVHIRKRFEAILADIFFATCEPLHAPDQPIPPEITASQLATSVVGLIEWWLDQEMPYPCRRMGEIYFRLRAGMIAGITVIWEG
jgi:AcrR family transcriptional regulator